MAATFNQRTANKGEIGNAIQQHELAHGIANNHLRAGGRNFPRRTRRIAEPGIARQINGIRETFRMSRYQNQQQIWELL